MLITQYPLAQLASVRLNARPHLAASITHFLSLNTYHFIHITEYCSLHTYHVICAQLASERLNARPHLAASTPSSAPPPPPHVGSRGRRQQAKGEDVTGPGGGRRGSVGGRGEEDVLSIKHKMLRRVYEVSGKKVVESPEFARFLADNAHWLKAYAIFCVLRDLYGTSDASQWGEMGALTYSQIDSLASPVGGWFRG
jgi:hypothetical protein